MYLIFRNSWRKGDGGVYMSEMAPGTTGYFQQYLKELQDKFKLKKFIFFF